MSAKISLRTTTGTVKDGESPYVLHPASIDGAIQLGLIACHGGQADRASTAFVPVHFSQLYLSNNPILQDLESITAIAKGEKQGFRNAHLDFAMLAPDGSPILQVEGLRCASYPRASQSLDKAYSSPFMRLLWKADIRALTNSQLSHLFPPPPENVERAPLWGVMDKLAHTIVYSIYKTFAGPNATKPCVNPIGEVYHFFELIKRRETQDDNALRQEFRGLSNAERLLKLDELVAQAPNVIEVQTSKLLHDSMVDILNERSTGMDVIISKGLLTPLYEKGLMMTGVYPQLFNVLDILAHANPNVRYIEIGGGTGGATRIAMRAFRGPNGIKSYKDYTFTDISPGFLNQAREALSDTGFQDMTYNVLDAEQDPSAHGYEPVYDVVISCQVLHATSDMEKTLSNVGKLLKPGGKLVLVETTQNFTVPGVVVGTFTGYWAGIPDGRVDAPFMSLEGWDKNLKAAGFSGTELVLDDFPKPHNTTSVIISTFTDSARFESRTLTRKDVQILYSNQAEPTIVRSLVQVTKERGHSAASTPLGDVLRSGFINVDVVVFLDDKHIDIGSNEDHLATFQHLARNAASLTVVTSCGIAKGRNPDGALIPGLLRVLKTENSAGQFLSIDIDANNFQIQGGDAEVEHLTRCITNQVLALRENSAGVEDGNPTDREFVWQDECLWVSRIVAVSEAEIPVPAEYYVTDSQAHQKDTAMLPIDTQDAMDAVFETPGVIGSLYFSPNKEFMAPLPYESIEVKVTAVSLGHDDLNAWSGRGDSSHSLTEYAGVVTATGGGITGLAIGEGVYGLSIGQIRVGNFARVPGALALKLQPGDDAIQMSTLPRAYLTVAYTFEWIIFASPEGLEGLTVLVQSATTDIGLATIVLAKARGAEVFATVDTPEKTSVLVAETCILASHVFASQDPASNIRRAATATRRGGFDLIISTSPSDSELGYLTQQFLNSLGQMIHIGRVYNQDMHVVNALNMDLLSRKNATFTAVDIISLLEVQLSLGGRLLRTVDTLYREGVIKPIPSIGGAAIDAADLQRTLPDFSKSIGDAGRLVVSFGNPKSKVKMALPTPTARFRSEACYVVTGALGGLGQPIVQWMVDRGARHLLLLSRRDITNVPNVQRLVDDLAKSGVDLQSVVCDVTDLAQVRSALSNAASRHPICGIIHAAVSWRDLSFEKLSASRWHESLAAKVQGTKNLHEATRLEPLDFFVMTTSLLSVYALATQAAYTTANNFQDAFARFRRAQGLPASTVSFSLIRDIGSTGSDPSTIDTFERNKTLTLSKQQFLALFEGAFLGEGLSAAAGVDSLSFANLITCLDPASMVIALRNGDSGSSPRWFSDGRLSQVLRAYADAQQHALGHTGQEGAVGDSRSSIALLQTDLEAGIRSGASGRTATIALVEGAITSTVAGMLFMDQEGIDPTKSVADYGVDSLIAAELRNWFVDALKTDISMLKLLDQSTSMSVLATKIVDDALAQVTVGVS